MKLRLREGFDAELLPEDLHPCVGCEHPGLPRLEWAGRCGEVRRLRRLAGGDVEVLRAEDGVEASVDDNLAARAFLMMTLGVPAWAALWTLAVSSILNKKAGHLS